MDMLIAYKLQLLIELVTLTYSYSYSYSYWVIVQPVQMISFVSISRRCTNCEALQGVHGDVVYWLVT